MDIKPLIRTIPNYPSKGIMYRDITSLIQNHKAFRYIIKTLAKQFNDKGINKIAAIESRGFIFGSALAFELELGIVLLRKKGKLPSKTISEEYKLEYGLDSLEIHIDSVNKGDVIILVDDLIATGGTALASINLIKRLGGVIYKSVFIIDLPDLKGRMLLETKGIDTLALVEFKGH